MYLYRYKHILEGQQIFLLLGCKEVKQRRTESSEKEIDWKCLLLPFSVCGSKKKQKIMYKSAKNAGEL